MPIYRNQTGLKLRLRVGANVNDATVTLIKYKKPSGNTGSWVASKENNGLSYVTTGTDLDESGLWQLQAYVETPEWTAHGKIGVIQITPSL